MTVNTLNVCKFLLTRCQNKTHRGLTSLDFAQLGAVHPSGPPYLHSVYFTGNKSSSWLPVSDKLYLNDALMTCKCMNNLAPFG